MPDSILLTLSAFSNMTDDAMLIVDPQSLRLRYASPRAVELIGPVLLENDVLASRVFNDLDRFATFVADALTVTEPSCSVSRFIPTRVWSASRGVG